LRFLLTDRDLAVGLGQNAKRNIQENFSIEKMTSQTEKAYSEVVNEV